MKISEFDMVNDCYTFIKDLIWLKYVALEVPFLSRCIDMVLVDKYDFIYTVEFKISNFNKAFEQAKDHSLGADFSFICMPFKKVNQILLKKENIGYISYHYQDRIKMKYEYYPSFDKNFVKTPFRNMLLANTIKTMFDKR
jgi:hypothetical protein